MEYKVPLEVIAKFRADYYAIEVDGYEPDSREYKEEYEYSLDNNEELVDYAFNNLNWGDVAPFAQFVSHVPIYTDYIKEWTNVNYSIKEE